MTFEKIKILWSEAISMLEPRNLGFLLLVSLRALKDTYKALFFAWFLPTALLAGLVLGIKSLVMAFYSVLLVRAARPSIELKRVSYWNQIVLVDWILFFMYLFFAQGIPFILKEKAANILPVYTFFLRQLFLGEYTWLPGSENLGFVHYFLSPFFIVCALFMLDSQKTVWEYIKAFGRAFLMLVYNYPFFLISYLGIRLIVSVFYMASQPFIALYPFLPLLGWILLYGLLVPFFVCFIMSFYVKQIHGQYVLYFKS